MLEYKNTSSCKLEHTVRIFAQESTSKAGEGTGVVVECGPIKPATLENLIGALCALPDEERHEVAHQVSMAKTHPFARAANEQEVIEKLKAERERDEARLERDRARASLDVVRHDLDGTRQELREAREDRDSLRSRLIAAESAAAAREPREYPLHQLSRWDGDAVVDVTGTRTRIVNEGRGAHSAIVDSKGSGPILADVLALAHRRGLV